MNTPLLAIAFAFMLVAIGIMLNQRRAKSCAFHRRWVGHLAGIVAISCVVISAVLTMVALLTSLV